jgi:hypothetical protein
VWVRTPDDLPVAFDAHPKLPDTAAKLLQIQYDDYRRAGEDDKAARLARLSASDAVGDIAAELNKEDRKNRRRYLHPTLWIDAWRNPRTRRGLQRLARKLPRPDLVLAAYRMVANDEPFERAHQTAKLLIEQVELATRPLRPEDVDRLIASERERAKLLRRAGA